MNGQSQISVNENTGQITLSVEQYNQLLIENAEKTAIIEGLKFELEKLKRLIFGSKSERFVPADSSQLSLDLGQEQEAAAKVAKIEQITYNRRKKEQKNGHGRQPLPAHLHREVIILEPTVDLSGAIKIGEAITEVLEATEAKIYVKRYIRYKYVLPDEKGIVIAELPSLPIPRGNAGPGLLSHILVSKFVDHLPFYRQRQIFKRHGIDMAESTMNDWFRCVCHLLDPLYDCMKRITQDSTYLSADETPIRVLTEDKPGASHKGYHWVYYDHGRRYAVFDYQKSRDRAGPKEMLKDFKGVLQTDGYTVYDIFENEPYNLTLLACFAHVRRKFDEAKINDRKRAEYMLDQIQKLYRIERTAQEQGFNPEQRKDLRQQQAPDILNEMHAWLKENIVQVLPKSAIGQAIAYTLHLWPRLIRYIDDGRYEIDNNLIENTIRPVALGRKNYLFAGSHEAAQRAAMMYSFFASCKLHNVEPFEWLKKVLERIPDHSIQRLEELLPGKLQ